VALANHGSAVRVPLLVIIFTQRSNEKRRSEQRATWLQHSWSRGEVRQQSQPAAASSSLAAWRYVYVMARDGREQPAELDVVVHDSVTLASVREGYANLVYKTLEAVRWALNQVAFGALLKTDDDSIVHVGRATAWLRGRGPRALAAVYAGRRFNDSQVIRHNFTKRNLLHPEWYPPDFTKWAVPFEALATTSLVDGLYYPPYCSGGGYMLGASAARKVVSAHDARMANQQPVVRVEDAYVGLLAAEAGVRATDISEMVQDPPLGVVHTPSVYAGQLIVHRVTDFVKAFEWITYPVHKGGRSQVAAKRGGRGGRGQHSKRRKSA